MNTGGYVGGRSRETSCPWMACLRIGYGWGPPGLPQEWGWGRGVGELRVSGLAPQGSLGV